MAGVLKVYDSGQAAWIAVTGVESVTLAGSLGYLTIVNQVITRNAIDLATDMTGDILTANMPAKFRTVTAVFYIENPTAAQSFVLSLIPNDITFVKVWGKTDVGTVDFNIERRAVATPDSVGTDILTSDLQAASTQATTTAFAASGAVAAEQVLNYNASAVASTPTKLWVFLEYTID